MYIISWKVKLGCVSSLPRQEGARTRAITQPIHSHNVVILHWQRELYSERLQDVAQEMEIN